MCLSQLSLFVNLIIVSVYLIFYILSTLHFFLQYPSMKSAPYCTYKNNENMHLPFIAIIIGLMSYIHIDAMLQKDEQYVHFQINVERERTKNVSRITLDCSSMERPFGQSAEFLINNETKANIRHINGTCAINRGICKKNECSCTNRTFVWSFIGHEDFRHRTYTCLLRFHQKNMNRHLLVYKTKTYEGSGTNVHIIFFYSCTLFC